MVTLLNMTVAGLVSRFGVSTASSEVNPSLLLVRQLTKAVSAELPRGPMSRSICATSLPSPTSDSPTQSLLILAITISSQIEAESEKADHRGLGRSALRLPLFQRSTEGRI